jgi:hypothetical protein
MRRCRRSRPERRKCDTTDFNEREDVLKTTKLKTLMATGVLLACTASMAMGPNKQGILGQIQGNYDQAIKDVPSVSLSNRDGRERERLRDLQSRDMNQMQSTLNQYSGGQQGGSGGPASAGGGQGSSGGNSVGSIGSGSVGKGSTGGAFYEFIRYRDNDPFLFCTDGQDPEKFPDRCWWPIAPFTGAFMMNPICRPPNPYGKDWTSADWDSLGQYLRVCPMAGGKSGPWNSKSGKQPNMVPHKH